MVDIEKALLEIEIYLKDKILKPTNAWNTDSDRMLNNKGFHFKVMKDYSFISNVKSQLTIPCICLKDGSVSYYRYSNLSQGKIRCSGCTISRYKEKCQLNNMDYISHRQDINLTIITVKCKIDGCERDVLSSHLLKGLFNCKECLKNKYITAAKSCGFEYLTNTLPSPKTILLRCKDDGNFIRTSAGSLTEGKVGCQLCEVNKYRKYLEVKNAVYVSHQTINGLRKVNYKNKSGEDFQVTAGQLTLGKFSVSKLNHWCLPHSLYVIKAMYNDNIYYKIGTSISPESRLKYFKLACEASVKKVISFSSRKEADAEESRLHTLFKEYRLPVSFVESFIGREVSYKDGKRKEGATEWFSFEVGELLKII